MLYQMSVSTHARHYILVFIINTTCKRSTPLRLTASIMLHISLLKDDVTISTPVYGTPVSTILRPVFLRAIYCTQLNAFLQIVSIKVSCQVTEHQYVSDVSLLSTERLPHQQFNGANTSLSVTTQRHKLARVKTRQQ